MKKETDEYYDKIRTPAIRFRELDINRDFYCEECDMWILKKYRKHIHRKEEFEEYLRIIKKL